MGQDGTAPAKSGVSDGSRHLNTWQVDALPPAYVAQLVAGALREDLETFAAPGSGGPDAAPAPTSPSELLDQDLSAQLIPPEQSIWGRVVAREPMVLCGRAFVEEAFRQAAPGSVLEWRFADGDWVAKGGNSKEEDNAHFPNDPDRAHPIIFTVRGTARRLVTAERTALNFLQMLSGVASRAREYAAKLEGTAAMVLDTRKTIPGLRLAQKYAVRCGGGGNHRLGLHDAFLIKENHLAAFNGCIVSAVAAAKKVKPDALVEVEVESLEELRKAIGAGVDVAMLDNFTPEMMREGVRVAAAAAAADEADGAAKGTKRKRLALEASGDVSLETIRGVAETGVDFVSVGALTKSVRAQDLSMRLFF
mmetsp:Transcript_75564/g.231191  ORF Transcript_75564/g.231191 Transcript_75564/m.231191 type:complete len:363 (-) Transcript_75564:108-1196(-)